MAARKTLIAPSILSADFSRLGEEVRAVDEAGADWIHIDVMDDHFVDNLTFGPPIVKWVRPWSKKFFDAHLMVSPVKPRLITDFVAAGVEQITVHEEAGPHLHGTLQFIRAQGIKAGVAINPHTPLEVLREVVALGMVDLVLLMTVNPGYGGQKFIPIFDKIRAARDMIETSGHAVHLQVDGGIDSVTAKQCVDAGADVLVAGSAVFKGDGKAYAANIAALRS